MQCTYGDIHRKYKHKNTIDVCTGRMWTVILCVNDQEKQTDGYPFVSFLLFWPLTMAIEEDYGYQKFPLSSLHKLWRLCGQLGNDAWQQGVDEMDPGGRTGPNGKREYHCVHEEAEAPEI